MRMRRSMLCAFWRPDPRHGAEPREPSYAEEIACRDGLPRRFRSSTLRAYGAGRLALEQIPQRGLQRPWAYPRTCARGCRRGSRSYPQFRCTNLTPVVCTDLGGQQIAGRPSHQGRDVVEPGDHVEFPAPTAARWVQPRPGRLPGTAHPGVPSPDPAPQVLSQETADCPTGRVRQRHDRPVTPTPDRRTRTPDPCNENPAEVTEVLRATATCRGPG